MARSISWAISPRLQTYRELLGKRSHERYRLAVRLGERLCEAVHAAGACGSVVCVEKPYLSGFADGFESCAVRGVECGCHPFVLLAVNGGDGPLTVATQARLLQLRAYGLRACYAHNLHASDAARGSSSSAAAAASEHAASEHAASEHAASEHARRMHPLPLGAMPIGGAMSSAAGDALLSTVRALARPWHQRDKRLLVAPMKLNSRQRSRYMDVLRGAAYVGLVRIVDDRLPLAAFLSLLAEHRCTLSPPGRGFDCFRTWQALAMGTTPLVIAEAGFDRSLLKLGPRAIPAASELSPQALAALLEAEEAAGPPNERAVQFEYWERKWQADLR